MTITWEPEVRHRKVRDCVAEMFGIEPWLMAAAARPVYVTEARQAGYWIVRRVFPELSFAMVGILYGGRDHSTVLHGLKVIDQKRTRSPTFATRLDVMLAAIGAPPVPGRVPVSDFAKIAQRHLPDHVRGEEFDSLFKSSARPDHIVRAIAADIASDAPRLMAVS